MVLPNNGLDLKAIVDAFENHLVDQALARTNNNKNRASELLHMNRTTLVEKLRKRGMIQTIGSRNRAKDASSQPTGASTGISSSTADESVVAMNIPGSNRGGFIPDVNI